MKLFAVNTMSDEEPGLDCSQFISTTKDETVEKIRKYAVKEIKQAIFDNSYDFPTDIVEKLNCMSEKELISYAEENNLYRIENHFEIVEVELESEEDKYRKDVIMLSKKIIYKSMDMGDIAESEPQEINKMVKQMTDEIMRLGTKSILFPFLKELTFEIDHSIGNGTWNELFGEQGEEDENNSK